jgi:hypothetical protein
MCYNCGCKKPDDDHGNPANITNRTFAEAAKAGNKGDEDKAKQNTSELINELRTSTARK